VIALIGLAGILLGEQLVPIAKKLIAGEPISIAWIDEHLHTHSFSKLPTQASALEKDSDQRS
jgi:xanthosine utilization system XapX-like protein